MARPLTLPRNITLPAVRDGMMPVGRLYAALGWRRQRAFAMRERHDFPEAENGMIDVQRAAVWLIRRGVSVHWI